MITWLNQWAGRSRFTRFWGIVKEVFWVDRYMLFEFCRNGNYSAAGGKGDIGVMWRVAAEGDIERMRELGGYDIDLGREEFMKSFVQSDHEYLLLGMRDEIIYTYAVCAVRAKRMYGLFFRLEEGEAFISVCFTKPESRGQGWGPKCLGEICRRCWAAGKGRVFIDISTANLPSIRSAEKAGAQKTDSGYYRIRIWKRDYLFPFGMYKNRFSTLNVRRK